MCCFQRGDCRKIYQFIDSLLLVYLRSHHRVATLLCSVLPLMTTLKLHCCPLLPWASVAVYTTEYTPAGSNPLLDSLLTGVTVTLLLLSLAVGSAQSTKPFLDPCSVKNSWQLGQVVNLGGSVSVGRLYYIKIVCYGRSKELLMNYENNILQNVSCNI